jgi:hypothetical protein
MTGIPDGEAAALHAQGVIPKGSMAGSKKEGVLSAEVVAGLVVDTMGAGWPLMVYPHPQVRLQC